MTRRRRPERLIRESLDRREREQSDVQPRRVLGAMGIGRHVVRARDGGLPFVVAGPPFTYRPGATVPTARHSSIDRAELLLAQSARRGASESPALVARGRTPAAPTVDPCAVSLGHSYIALHHNSGTKTLRAWRYLDDAYSADVAVIDYTSQGWSSIAFSKAILASGSVYFLARRSGFDPDDLARWNLSTNTISTEVLSDEDFDGPVLRGATLHLMLRSGTVAQAWTVPLGLGGSNPGGSYDWDPSFGGSGFPLAEMAILPSGEFTRGTDGIDTAWAQFGGVEHAAFAESDESFDNFGYPGTLAGGPVAVAFRVNSFGSPEKQVHAIDPDGQETNLWPPQWISGSSGTTAELRTSPNGLEYIYLSDTGEYYRGPIVDASALSCSWPGVVVELHPSLALAPQLFLPED